MKTKLTQLMCNRDRLMIRKMKLPWYSFYRRRYLKDVIGEYKRLIDIEMEEQEDKLLEE